MQKIIFTILMLHLPLLLLLAQESEDAKKQETVRATELYLPVVKTNASTAPSLYEKYQHVKPGTVWVLPAFRLNDVNSAYVYQKSAQIPLYPKDFDVSGIILPLYRGEISGRGYEQNWKGIGIANQVSVSYYQQLGQRFVVGSQLRVNKMRTSYFSDQFVGLSGVVGYQLNHRVHLKVFGDYTSYLPINMPSYAYGFSSAVDVTNRFGMELGVRRLYDPFGKQWETLPVVAPYYKFKKMTIGMDVGEVLLHSLESLLK